MGTYQEEKYVLGPLRTRIVINLSYSFVTESNIFMMEKMSVENGLLSFIMGWCFVHSDERRNQEHMRLSTILKCLFLCLFFCDIFCQVYACAAVWSPPNTVAMHVLLIILITTIVKP